jgi:hypothetical protein
MIQPDSDVLKAFAHVALNVPRVGAYFTAWRDHEVNRLPVTATGNQAVASGRCQILQEVCGLLKDAPDVRAPK